MLRSVLALLILALSAGPARAQGEAPTPPEAPGPAVEVVGPERLEGLLVGRPGLFRVGSDRATVQWIARGAIAATVRWGTAPDALDHAVDVPANEGATEVLLEGLPTDSEVWYACAWKDPESGAWVGRPPQAFRTARAPGATYRFGVLSGSQLFVGQWVEGLNRNVRDALTAVGEDELDFVVFLGDEVGVHFLEEHPRMMNAQRALSRWRDWRRFHADLLEHTPSFLVLGSDEGEAGYLREGSARRQPKYFQRWGTVARKQTFPNPLPTTNPEGGEDEGFFGSISSPAGGGHEGHRSPLQNYYAFTWGDALIVALDVYRYTNPGGERPTSPGEWTLGEAQLAWLERTLEASEARWKVVLGHHVLGGADYDDLGRPDPGARTGRGGARYALRGEQARITALMREHGARFFLTGYDKVFAHQAVEGVEYVTCGRSAFLQSPLWDSPGWLEAYGGEPGFVAALGYTRVTVGPEELVLEFVRTSEDLVGAENVPGELGSVVYRWTTSEPSPLVVSFD